MKKSLLLLLVCSLLPVCPASAEETEAAAEESPQEYVVSLEPTRILYDTDFDESLYTGDWLTIADTYEIYIPMFLTSDEIEEDEDLLYWGYQEDDERSLSVALIQNEESSSTLSEPVPALQIMELMALQQSLGYTAESWVVNGLDAVYFYSEEAGERGIDIILNEDTTLEMLFTSGSHYDADADKIENLFMSLKTVEE